MFRLIIIITIILAAYLFAKKWQEADDTEKKQLAFRGGMGVLVSLLVFLTVTGRLHVLAALFTGLLPFARRWWPWLRAGLKYVPWVKRMVGAQSPDVDVNTVETSLLRMHLNRESMEISGKVISGNFAGSELSTLHRQDLLQLYDFASQLPDQSEPLLNAYLEQRIGKDWKTFYDSTRSSQQSNSHQSGGPSDFGGALSESEAYEILGLSSEASESDVIAAHRRLIQKVHPDRGGSNYLASRINAAKKLLLDKLRRQTG